MVTSPARTPGAPASAARRSPTGLAGAVVARMSNPPPNVSVSLAPLTNDPVMTAPVTRVKTTSVNIASVTPVRNRLASGYASDSLRTGASRRLRPKVAVSAPLTASALYMSAQLAPTTIARPERMNIEKFVLRSPSSHRLIGRTNHATSASPAVV